MELPESVGTVGRHSDVTAVWCCQHTENQHLALCFPWCFFGYCFCLCFEICPLKLLQKRYFGGHMQFKWQSEVILLLNTPELPSHLPCADGVFMMLLALALAVVLTPFYQQMSFPRHP